MKRWVITSQPRTLDPRFRRATLPVSVTSRSLRMSEAMADTLPSRNLCLSPFTYRSFPLRVSVDLGSALRGVFPAKSQVLRGPASLVRIVEKGEKMKRSQVAERNRSIETQQPVPSLESDQIPMSSSFGLITRKQRFTKTSSRDNSDLEGRTSPVHVSYSTLVRTRSGELAFERQSNRRSPSKDFAMLENSHGANQSIRNVVGASDRVLRSSQARVSSEDPKLKIFRDLSPGIAASALSSVDELGQDFSSPVMRKSAYSKGPQLGLAKDDRGKENRDPCGEVGGTSRRSPLPEWYSRKPLQDITNALALGLGDEQQPQPKKKLKKKVGSVVASSFPTLGETQPRRKDSTTTQPKCPSIATPKQFSNLGKNFR